MRAGGSRTDGHDRRGYRLDAVSAAEVAQALSIIRSSFPATSQPSITVPTIRGPISCVIKLENEAPTSSFKARGAAHYCAKAIAAKPLRETVLVTASTGNHGAAVAWYAREHGHRVLVIVPELTPASKIKKIVSLGAEIVRHGSNLDDCIKWCRANYSDAPYLFVPNLHPDIIVGHSTLGAEFFAEPRPIDVAFFPIGIGSGISGMAIARNALSPSTKLIGVVPDQCSAWHRSFLESLPVEVPPGDTIADGLKTAKPDHDIFVFLKRNLENILTVTENEISHACSVLSDRFGVAPEGAGAVGLAGLQKWAAQHGDASRSLSLGTVLCGTSSS